MPDEVKAGEPFTLEERAKIRELLRITPDLVAYSEGSRAFRWLLTGLGKFLIFFGTLSAGVIAYRQLKGGG